MTELYAIENSTFHSAKRVKLFSVLPQVFDFLTSRVCFQDLSSIWAKKLLRFYIVCKTKMTAKW